MKNGAVQPAGGPGPVHIEEQMEPLSQILRELNERFGTDFTDEDKVFISNFDKKWPGTRPW